MQKRFDFIFIGAGIVGLATAYTLLKKNPYLSIAILEKEPEVALHQTGRNSGVIHSGVYYKPGSLKARLSREGGRELTLFCQKSSIPIKELGKVIVATRENELPNLLNLSERAKQNGITSSLLSKEELKEKEPFVEGLKALWIPGVSIVSFSEVARALKERLLNAGASFYFNTKVQELIVSKDQVRIDRENGSFLAKYLINAAGLHSDRIAVRCSGKKMIPNRIVPFKGEYYELSEDAKRKVNGLIYPVSDPTFPFLGVHFTPKIDGSVEAGPNAVLSLDREGYSSRMPSRRDASDIIFYKGFWKMAFKYARQGIEEYRRSLSKKLFLHDLQRLIPSLKQDDLQDKKAGIRAQVVTPDGNLFDDFLLHKDKRVLHILNAPSPAATASFAIGRHIVDLLDKESGLLKNESCHSSGGQRAEALAHIP